MAKFFDIVHSLIKRPGEYFKEVSERDGIEESFVIYFVYTIIMSVVYAIYTIVQMTYYDTGQYAAINNFLGAYGPFVIFFGVLIFYIIFSLAIVFLAYGILHLFILIFGGKGKYKDTFNSLALSAIPAYIITPVVLIIQTVVMLTRNTTLLLFISILLSMISLGASVCVIILQVISISITHKISKVRAALGLYLIPGILLVLFFFFIILLLVLGYGGYFTG